MAASLTSIISGIFLSFPQQQLIAQYPNDLTAEQLATLLRNLQQHVDYLQSLLTRIEQQAFPPTDQLRLRVLFTLDQFEALLQVVEKLVVKQGQPRHVHDGCATAATGEEELIGSGLRTRRRR